MKRNGTVYRLRLEMLLPNTLAREILTPFRDSDNGHRHDCDACFTEAYLRDVLEFAMEA